MIAPELEVNPWKRLLYNLISFFSKIFNYKYSNILLIAIYAAIIIFVSSFHELWHDEARALNYILESRSVKALLSSLVNNNEGHPFLWYIILYSAYKLFNSTVVLKAINIFFAVASVALILRKSPFPSIIKLMFSFGYIMLFLFPVLNRGYSLSGFLILLVCALYGKRKEYFVVLSVVLFLLANTHAFGVVVAAAFLVSFIFEFIADRTLFEIGNKYFNAVIIGLVIIISGILLSAAQAFPDKTTIVTSVYYLTVEQIMSNFIRSFVVIGENLKDILFINNIYIISVIVWLFIIYTFRKFHIGIIALLSIAGFNLFSNLIYKAHILHQALLFIVIIGVFWIDLKDREMAGRNTEVKSSNKKYWSMIIYGILVAILFFHCLKAFKSIKSEICLDYSSSKSFAEMLNTNNMLKNAIIVGEPDYLIESILYYNKRFDIYIPRESRFGKVPSLTVRNKRIFSLKELLATAKKLKDNFNRPVVIVLGHKLSAESPFSIQLPFNKVFNYTRESLKLFNENTVQLADFNKAFSDEKYKVYLLKGPDKL
ncbi:MAG: hypothetical protein ABII27_04850 [bacterium]